MKTNTHFFIIPRSVLLRIKNVLDRFVENNEKRILCSVTFFFENRTFCEIMWKNIVQRCREQLTIRIAFYVDS